MAWVSLPLQDAISALIDYRGKTPEKSNSGVRLITAKVIKSGRILDDRQEYIPEEAYDAWMRRGLPKQGDVLLTTEAPLGEVAQLRSRDRVALAQRVILLRADPRILDNGFLFYSLQGHDLQDQLASRATGTTVLGIKQSELRKVQVKFPPLPTQRRIASVLSAYDDLIENNTRRIAILEEMARRLYEEWFVQFRFPGHEEAEFVETELGRVPATWAIASFVTIAEVMSGGTPKKTEPSFWGGTIPFFTPRDAPQSTYALNTADLITEAGLAKCNSKLYPKDTVFITARGTVGKVALASQDMAMNQSCYALRTAHGFGQLFLFLATKATVNELRTRSHGAVFDTIIVDTFRQMSVVVPEKAIAQSFEERVQPLFALVLNLQRKNANLRAQRDLLLPKLISGEIDVSSLPLPGTEDQAA